MILLLLSVLVYSCDTHQFPGEHPTDPTLVNILLNIKINQNRKEFYELDFAHSKAGISGTQTLRAIIEVYKFDDQNNPVARKEVVLNSTDLDADISESFKLNATKYKVVVWIDYVNLIHQKDQYYDTGKGLRLLKFTQPHEGNTDQRDAFSGTADIDLTPYRDQWSVEVEVPMVLYRPVAKYVLIANDVEKYIETVMQSKVDPETKAEINTYTAKIFYQGFTPVGFDAYKNQLNDAITGLYYTSHLEIIENKDALICFDYPLANATGSKVITGIQIFDKEGNILNEIDQVEIPVTRGEITIIRSDFLTRGYSSGVVVDPDYDGVIDVVLPD